MSIKKKIFSYHFLKAQEPITLLSYIFLKQGNNVIDSSMCFVNKNNAEKHSTILADKRAGIDYKYVISVSKKCCKKNKLGYLQNF